MPGWRALGVTASPIEGGDGNREFLLAAIKERGMTTLTIARLGAQGDGVAETERGPVYVPFALPGERVNAAIEGERGTLLAILQRFAGRVSSRPAGISAIAAAARSSIWPNHPTAPGSATRSPRRWRRGRLRPAFRPCCQDRRDHAGAP